MDEAQSRTSRMVYTADVFAALSLAERTALRETLVCTACQADAYFIRQARNGRRACFGARPHEDDCELASFITEDGGGAALDEVDEKINAGNVFKLEPNRDRTIRHVRHDPGAGSNVGGSAARYIRRGSREARVSSMNLSRLLRQLVLRPTFRTSKTLLIMSDDSRQTVRSGCVHLSQIETKHRNRLRVYWGTLRFAKLKDGGGAWLNTGWGSPTLVVRDDDELERLLVQAGVEELEDLSGSFFAFMGRLRLAASMKEYLFVEDLEWLALRTFAEDEGTN